MPWICSHHRAFKHLIIESSSPAVLPNDDCMYGTNLNLGSVVAVPVYLCVSYWRVLRPNNGVRCSATSSGYSPAEHSINTPY
eukprot:scaffold37289_cov37-Prasinocladus_malaysianus.AAC.1